MTSIKELLVGVEGEAKLLELALFCVAFEKSKVNLEAGLESSDPEAPPINKSEQLKGS